MGFRFRKQIGPKGLKLNIGKSGINSSSVKIAKGITYNSKRGLTVGIPGTGISFNFGANKGRKVSRTIAQSQLLTKTKKRFSWPWFIFWVLLFFPCAIIYWFIREH